MQNYTETVEIEGGYLIPEVINKPRPGFWGAVARFFRIKWGWTEYRLADEIRKVIAEKMNIVVEREFSKALLYGDRDVAPKPWPPNGSGFVDLNKMA